MNILLYLLIAAQLCIFSTNNLLAADRPVVSSEPVDDSVVHRVLTSTAPPVTPHDTVAVTVRDTDSLRARALQFVEAEIQEEIDDGLTWRRRWAKCSNAYECLSILCMGGSTVLAFSSGFFTIPALAYAAGATGTIGLVLKGFSSYASGESAERTASVNAHLRHLGIDTLPVIANPSLQGGPQDEGGSTLPRRAAAATNPV